MTLSVVFKVDKKKGGLVEAIYSYIHHIGFDKTDLVIYLKDKTCMPIPLEDIYYFAVHA